MESVGVINKSELIDFRDGVEADHAYIYSSWLQGLRYANDYFELIEKSAYFEHQHARIEAILKDFEVTVRIACLRDDPSVILGYCVYKNDRLDFVLVKNRWRGIGLARDLVPAGIATTTHLTKTGTSILKKHPNVRFNPYIE